VGVTVISRGSSSKEAKALRPDHATSHLFSWINAPSKAFFAARDHHPNFQISSSPPPADILLVTLNRQLSYNVLITSTKANSICNDDCLESSHSRILVAFPSEHEAVPAVVLSRDMADSSLILRKLYSNRDFGLPY